MAREPGKGACDEAREATGKVSSSSISSPFSAEASSVSLATSEPRSSTPPTTWEKLSDVRMEPWLFTVFFNKSLKRGAEALDTCSLRIAADHTRDGSRFIGSLSKSDLFDYRFDFPFDSSACKVAAIVDGAFRERDCEIALIRLPAKTTSLMAAMRAPAWSSIVSEEDAKAGHARDAEPVQARLSDMAMLVTLNTSKGKKFVLLRRVPARAGTPVARSDKDETIARLRSKLASAKTELHALCATLKSMKVSADGDCGRHDGDEDVGVVEAGGSSKERSEP